MLPLPNAQVTVTDTRTGNTQEYTTNAQGLFSAQNLTTGGPYTISATASGYQGQTVEQIFTSLQGATQLTFNLTAGSDRGRIGGRSSSPRRASARPSWKSVPAPPSTPK